MRTGLLVTTVLTASLMMVPSGSAILNFGDFSGAGFGVYDTNPGSCADMSAVIDFDLDVNETTGNTGNATISVFHHCDIGTFLGIPLCPLGADIVLGLLTGLCLYGDSFDDCTALSATSWECGDDGFLTDESGNSVKNEGHYLYVETDSGYIAYFAQSPPNKEAPCGFVIPGQPPPPPVSTPPCDNGIATSVVGELSIIL